MVFILVLVLATAFSCTQKSAKTEDEMNAPFTFMNLDPGHFHAALVQKFMYDEVHPMVYVYAPQGPELDAYLEKIKLYNSRPENPTAWDLEVYAAPDFYSRMIDEKPGNVMVVSGNNAKKTEYIHGAVDAGINVLADKPMAIDPDGFDLLKQAFQKAEENNVLLYDIMTERYEITTILQKRLSQVPEVFGELVKGTPEEPAVTKESVHHFFKYVSGSPLVRPAWFFDVEQQGEGIVDVTTHLVDLIQWECFPGEIIDYENEVKVYDAKRWATKLTPAQFEQVTKMDHYPAYLQKDVRDDSILHVYANGEIHYTLRGVHAKAVVMWNYQAPEGAKDTHYSIMRGSKANLVIRQGKEEDYQTVLYIDKLGDMDDAAFEEELRRAVEGLEKEYAGLGYEKNAPGQWKLVIPDAFKVGHEAHFAQVTEKYLKYLQEGALPDWEVPNMIAKYYTTTTAYALSR
jgi:predicted dehydrogenase